MRTKGPENAPWRGATLLVPAAGVVGEAMAASSSRCDAREVRRRLPEETLAHLSATRELWKDFLSRRPRDEG